MLDLAVDTFHGFPEPPAVTSVLTAALLESLAAMAVECDLMRRLTPQYSLTKHVHAIEDCVRDMRARSPGRVRQLDVHMNSPIPAPFLPEYSMSLHEALFAVNQFVFDVVGLAARLDSVSAKDDPATIAEIVRTGRLEYGALMNQAAMRGALADAPLVRVALDYVQFRLKFLELACRKRVVAANDGIAARTRTTKQAR